MNKRELLDELDASRERMLELIDDLEDAAYEEVGDNGAWSLKDILAHLTRWEAELVKLLWQVSQGEAPTTAHFSGISMDILNEKWLREMRSRPVRIVLEDFHNVRNQTMRRLEAFSEQELNDPKHYRWLRGKPLCVWVAADTFEHEIEHYHQIKDWKDKRSGV